MIEEFLVLIHVWLETFHTLPIIFKLAPVLLYVHVVCNIRRPEMDIRVGTLGLTLKKEHETVKNHVISGFKHRNN